MAPCSRCGSRGSGRLRGLRLQIQEPGPPLPGSPLLPQLWEVLFTTSLFPEIGGEAQGKLGPEGLGRDGRREASTRPGKVPVGRGNRWRQPAFRMLTLSPVPCLETFPRVGWPVPLGIGTGSSGRVTEGSSGLPSKAGGPGDRGQGPVIGHHLSCSQMPLEPSLG